MFDSFLFYQILFYPKYLVIFQILFNSIYNTHITNNPDNLLVCGQNLRQGEKKFSRCLDANSGEEFIKKPRMIQTPEKVVNVFAKKFSVIITKSYDCYVWGEFADYFMENFLNPFEKFGKVGGLDSEDEDQAEYDRKSVKRVFF